MFPLRIALISLSFLVFVVGKACAQLGPAIPYGGQLKSDPAVGNFQGAQRQTRQLKTDPDQGEGFSYHVYPVSESVVQSSPVIVAMGGPGQQYGVQMKTADVPVRNELGASNIAEREQKTAALRMKRDNLRGQLVSETNESKREALAKQIVEIDIQLESPIPNPSTNIPAEKNGVDLSKQSSDEPSVASLVEPQRFSQAIAPYGLPPVAAYSAPMLSTPPALVPTAFDWTAGLRSGPVGAMHPLNVPTGNAAYAMNGWGPSGFPFAAPYLAAPTLDPGLETKAISVTRKGLTYTTPEIYHQPLIQIKLRVIEVARANGTSASSVLEYVSRANSNPSLTSGLPLNGGFENTRGLTRFGVSDVISNATTGTGMLVNLTTEHINWVASLLATEFEADIVTAPELVTLNGENVEFLAGEKVPFELGQNVIQGTNNNIQQVFYKHVGTLVSVTPRIVNWGLYGEGGGSAPFTNQDIADWNLLVQWMSDTFGHKKIQIGNGAAIQEYDLNQFMGLNAKPVPISVRGHLMMILGNYSKQDLIASGFPVNEICVEEACAWSPNNCTIDLSVVVRLSDSSTTDVDPDGNKNLAATTKESNVRAVANIVQLKSGHGVVMAGLIGERENRNTAKVPVLGDLPIIGAAFRSRATTRVKTEVLIFAEATVLPSDPNAARYESSRDFRLSSAYVNGDVLENPLECSLQRSGIGPKIGPCNDAERRFWHNHGQNVRAVRTQTHDIFE